MNQRETIFLKPLLAVTLVCAIVASVLEYWPQTSSLEWKSFDEAQRVARALNKPVFLDVYANWCGPCRMMDRTVFTDDSVRRIMNEKYVLAKINIDDPAWRERATSNLRVNALPTYLIFSPKGKEWSRKVGVDFGNPVVSGFKAWIADSSYNLLRKWQRYHEAMVVVRSHRWSLMVVVVPESTDLEPASLAFESDSLWKFLEGKITPTLVTDSPADSALYRSLPLLPGRMPQVLILDRNERLLGRFYIDEQMRSNEIMLVDALRQYLPKEEPLPALGELDHSPR
jgi:thiol-disulfide isomerase/thioredoxin